LHSYSGPGEIVSFEVGVRRIPKRDVTTLVTSWQSVAEKAPANDYSNVFLSKFEEAHRLGTEIAFRHLTNSDMKVPGQGERISRGPIAVDKETIVPKVGPINGGVAADEALVIYVDSWRRTGPEFRVTGSEVGMGSGFERTTSEAWFGVFGDQQATIDRSTVRREYTSNFDSSWSKPEVDDLRVGVNAIVLHVKEMQAGEVAKILWAWTKASKRSK
jgi:hypothetical protein